MAQLELLRRKFSVEEYLTIERSADFKSQYLDGEIYAMAEGSPQHNAIAANTIIAFGIALRAKPCQVYTSDQRVRTSLDALYSYPDVAVVCDEPQFHDEKRDVITNPLLLVEVLSETTQEFDRGLKFDKYAENETLTDYLLIAQDRPEIEHRFRQPGGDWETVTVTGLENRVKIGSLDCPLALADVYHRIAFGAAETPV